jgi:SpoVK/Ycf46/Vps4 family AAA+-type ATPase
MSRTPRWIQRIEEGYAGGYRGFLLTFNTTDWLLTDGLFGDPNSRPAALIALLREWLGRQGYSVARYTLADGLRVLAGDPAPWNGLPTGGPEVILAACTARLREEDPPRALILDYADHLVPDPAGMNALLTREHLQIAEILHEWGLDGRIRRTRNRIFLISHENQVHDLLRRSGYLPILIPLPDLEERLRFIRWYQEQHPDLPPGRGQTPEQIARWAGGLRLRDLEILFRQARARKEPVDLPAIAAAKRESIRNLARDLLEVFEPEYGFEEVAGLPHALRYFRELKDRLQQPNRPPEDRSFPQAILLVGPPGTGKSFLVLAVAREFGLPCLAMRNIRERWVGASERNLERVLQIIEDLSPCLVWIDELDQALGFRTTGESADAGTSERLLARIWEFMGAMRHRLKVLWIGTTNRPDLLDPATLDRFPVVIPILPPGPEDLPALFRKLAHQLGRTLEPGVDLEAVAALPELRGITVRGLQEVVAWAAHRADLRTKRPGAPIAQSDLEAAARDYKPNFHPLRHEYLTLLALRMTSFHSLLPWSAGGGIPEAARRVVTPEGRLDPEALARRLRELEEQLGAERWRRAF